MKFFTKVLLIATMLVTMVPAICSAGAVKVQKVSSFPDKIGQWQFVDSFPDFTIQFVDSFPDIKIQYVDSFPGVK